jgi:hypothetical protein
MYQIFTFQPNGHLTTLVNTKFETKELAGVKMAELQKVFNVPMMVKEISSKKK